MKVLSVIVLVLGLSSSGISKPNQSHYLVQKHILELLPDKGRSIEKVREKENRVLVRLTPLQAEAISSVVHRKIGACGGLMVVEEEVNSAGITDTIFRVSPGEKKLNLPKKPSEIEAVKSLFRGLSKERLIATHKNVISYPNRHANRAAGIKFAGDLVTFANSLSGRSQLRPDILQIPTPGFPQNSVIVRVPGKDSSLPGVLVGSHMDTISCNFFNCKKSNQNNQGADDDGSGVASVMELLRVHLESGQQFNRDAYYAFYAAEEHGLHGSKAVVRHFQKSGTQFAGIMQLDMTGYNSGKGQEIINLVTDFTHPELTAFTRMLAINHLGLSSNQIGLMKCNYECSDHASWTAAGYPSVFPFEEPMNRINPHIHSEDDTVSHIDFDKAFIFLKLGGAFVAELANIK